MGNLISWSLILIAFVASYSALKGTVAAAEVTAKEAKTLAFSTRDQVYSMKTDIEVIKVTTQNTDKKVDELRAFFASAKLIKINE